MIKELTTASTMQELLGKLVSDNIHIRTYDNDGDAEFRVIKGFVRCGDDYMIMYRDATDDDLPEENYLYCNYASYLFRNGFDVFEYDQEDEDEHRKVDVDVSDCKCKSECNTKCDCKESLAEQTWKQAKEDLEDSVVELMKAIFDPDTYNKKDKK